MKAETKVRILSDGPEGFFQRAREHAAKLDRGEKPAQEMVITFEDASDLVRVLSAERIRLLRAARPHPLPMSQLASGLKRDARAVSRDVALLEQFGLLKTRYEANPGHGKRRIVASTAPKYQLTAEL
ncbi:MAG: HVO_A0114 family putative DNA-binding protein [Acidobacteriaceae bacterium]